MFWTKYTTPVNVFKVKEGISHFEKQYKMKAVHLLISVLFTVMAILIGLVILIGYILYQEISSIYPEKIVEFSIPCIGISLSPDEDFETFSAKKSKLKFSISSDGQYICSGTDFTNLIYLVVERRSRLRFAEGVDGHPYLSCGNESFASKSGHLLVAFSKLSRHQQFADGDSDVILYWDTLSRHSIIESSVHYHNGEISIAEGRTYFIYVSVHFNISQEVDENIAQFNKLYQFSVRICRRVSGYEQTLLGATKKLNISTANAASSLRIGSHLELSKKDTIYIKVSNAKRLIHNSNGNTFGLFPI